MRAKAIIAIQLPTNMEAANKDIAALGRVAIRSEHELAKRYIFER